MAGYDFTNKTFGKLTARKIAKKDNSGHNYWQCDCECGNTIIVRSTELMNGKTTMCNSCKKKSMGYFTKPKSEKKQNIIADDGKQWLKDVGIEYKNIDNFSNVVDIRKMHDFNHEISILSAPIVYKIVHAINADLTYAESTYVGSEIFIDSLAQQIDEFFHIRNQLNDLSCVEWDVGEVIYTAPVYHLLTKPTKNDQVTYDDVYTCLTNLKEKASEHGNYYLAFPRICCGKDKLNWDIVLQIILDIFCEDFNIMLF